MSTQSHAEQQGILEYSMSKEVPSVRDKMSLHKFYTASGRISIELWAEDWASAIKKFRGMFPDIPFKTENDMRALQRVPSVVQVA